MEDIIVIPRPEWHKQLCRNLDSLQQKGVLCDTVILGSDEQEVRAHSCVLSAASQVLKEAVLAETSNVEKIIVSELNSAAWRVIVNFIYTAELHLQETDDVDSGHILNAAVELKMTDLEEAVQQYIENKQRLIEEVAQTQVPVEVPLEQVEEPIIEGESVADVVYINGEILITDKDKVGAETYITTAEELEFTQAVFDEGTEYDTAQSILISLNNKTSPRKPRGSKANKEDIVELPVAELLCSVCGRAFEDEKTLENHMVKDHDEGIQEALNQAGTVCGKCNKTFDTSEDLKEHSNTEHPDNIIYACDLCEKKFSFHQTLMSHYEKCRKAVAVCSICQKRFANKDSLNKHMEIRHNPEPKPYSCDVCYKTFGDQTMLNSHKAVHSIDKPYGCSECEFRTKTKPCLRMHMRTMHNEEKKYQCEMCAELFATPAQLQAHLKKKHEPTNLFKCNICHKDYKNKSILKHHILENHQNFRPFKCDYCDLTFKRKSTRNSHVDIVHMNVRKFRCHQCMYASQTANGLKMHIQRRHDPSRPAPKRLHKDRTYTAEGKLVAKTKLTFPCPECDITFPDRALFKEHAQLVHGGVVANRCKYCDFKCDSRVMLKQHMVSVHKERMTMKPYVVCVLCPTAYQNESDLLIHYKYTHEDTKDLIQYLNTGVAMGYKMDDMEPWQNYSCFHCAFGTKSESNLHKHYKEFHLVSHNNDIYSCITCEGLLGNLAQVYNHFMTCDVIKAHHNPLSQSGIKLVNTENTSDTKDTYKCSKCDGVWIAKSIPDLMSHFQSKHDTVLPIVHVPVKVEPGSEHSVILPTVKTYMCAVCSKEYGTLRFAENCKDSHTQPTPDVLTGEQASGEDEGDTKSLLDQIKTDNSTSLNVNETNANNVQIKSDSPQSGSVNETKVNVDEKGDGNAIGAASSDTKENQSSFVREVRRGRPKKNQIRVVAHNIKNISTEESNISSNISDNITIKTEDASNTPLRRSSRAPKRKRFDDEIITGSKLEKVFESETIAGETSQGFEKSASSVTGTPTTKYRCYFCKRVYTTPEEVKACTHGVVPGEQQDKIQGVPAKRSETYKCRFCSKMFVSVASVTVHVETVHKQQSANIVQSTSDTIEQPTSSTVVMQPTSSTVFAQPTSGTAVMSTDVSGYSTVHSISETSGIYTDEGSIVILADNNGSFITESTTDATDSGITILNTEGVTLNTDVNSTLSSETVTVNGIVVDSAAMDTETSTQEMAPLDTSVTIDTGTSIGTAFRCICAKEFLSEEDVLAHVGSEHEGEGDIKITAIPLMENTEETVLFKCFCGADFTSKEEVFAHVGEVHKDIAIGEGEGLE